MNIADIVVFLAVAVVVIIAVVDVTVGTVVRAVRENK